MYKKKISSIGVQKKILPLRKSPPPLPHHFSNGPSLISRQGRFMIAQTKISCTLVKFSLAAVCTFPCPKPSMTSFVTRFLCKEKLSIFCRRHEQIKLVTLPNQRTFTVEIWKGVAIPKTGKIIASYFLSAKDKIHSVFAARMVRISTVYYLCMHLQFSLRFSSSDGCERVDELWKFRWGYIHSEHL